MNKIFMKKIKSIARCLIFGSVVLAVSLTGVFAQSKNTENNSKTSLDGLTEVLTIDGQPALRILGKKGTSTEIRSKLINGKETFIFLVVTIPSIAGKSYDGKLHVSKEKVWFQGIGNKDGDFEFESSQIEKAEMVSNSFGRFSLVKIKTANKKIQFQIHFENADLFNGNKAFALPANNFLVKSILDFDAALAEFKKLTSTEESKKNEN